MKKTFMVYGHYYGDGVDSYKFTCCNYELHLQGYSDRIKFCPACASKIDEKIGSEIVEEARRKKNKTFIDRFSKPDYVVYSEILYDLNSNWDKQRETRLNVVDDYKNNELYSKEINRLASSLFIAKGTLKKIEKERNHFSMYIKYRIVIEKIKSKGLNQEKKFYGDISYMKEK